MTCRQLLFRMLCCLCLLPATGCDTPDTAAAALPAPYTVDVPSNLGSSVPSPAHNPLTEEGIALGRMLFYDPALSKDGTISCASCHQQDKAFSDGLALSSAGASGEQLQRHVPSLANLAWMDGLFWDGGAKNLEAVNFGPLTHPDEMGQNLKELVQKLQQHGQYPQLFRKAFGTDSITSAHITRALAQFQRTLVSADSRYDSYTRGEAGGELTSLELEGLTLFKQHCSSCHATDLFTDNSYHNNGLDSNYSDADEEVAYGRGRITQQAADKGKFKTPTLRNIAITAPYMHDGRFRTLEQVLAHYTSGVKPSPTLAPQLQQQGSLGIALSEEEQKKLLLFLHTLTDKTFVQNKALATPY